MVPMIPTEPVSGPVSTGKRVGLMTTYPPSHCGIANHSLSLVESLSAVAPEIDIDVVRLVLGSGPTTRAIGEASIVVDPETDAGRRMAARRLNENDAVVFQHEFGIYGADDGEAILDLLDMVHRPKMAVLHTVVAHPSERQRRIVGALDRASSIVVLSASAQRTLDDRYGIPATRTRVIPHGAHWKPTPINPPPHRRMITWGLLGPGKGLERAIRAVAALRDLHPRPVYQIVGRTHPSVVERVGSTYRRGLERLVTDLGITDMVEFVDRYVTEGELLDMVAGSDVVVLPYDNAEQVSSGVLTEAVALGRPVVATKFPHARELLDEGPGLTVDHDSAALAVALHGVLVDPGLYADMARAAAEASQRLSWASAAEEYAAIIGSVIAERISA
jgi:polysaccharide biosynthesis protein PslF